MICDEDCFNCKFPDCIWGKSQKHSQTNKKAECQKRYYERNKEKIAERYKRYYERNKEKIAEYQKQYREKNKAKIAEYQRQYYQERKNESGQKNICLTS